MGRLEIGRAKRTTDAMIGDQLIHPCKALQVVAIELARLRRAHHSQSALRIPAEYRAVRHVREARDRKRSRPHVIRKIVARRRLRGDPVFPPWVWTSTEMVFRGMPSAAEAVSAVRATAVEPRGPTPPASIASTEGSAMLHSQGRGVRACP